MCYDPCAVAHNAAVIEQLHMAAREDHEEICGRVASRNLQKLDLLQARTLRSATLGHRCARSSLVGLCGLASLGASVEADLADSVAEADPAFAAAGVAPVPPVAPAVPPVVAAT